MAGNIKGITVEIGGNTQPLNKALEEVNRKGRSLQSELKAIDKLLKLDPTNTVLLAQKQQVLAESINNTRAKLESLKTAQQQAAQQLANGEIGEEQYRALTREVEATEQSLNRLENEARETDAALEAAGSESAETANDIRRVGDASRESASETRSMSSQTAVSFAAITATVTAVINTITQLISKFKEAAVSSAVWADTINTMSAQYHVSTEALQKFAYAADLVDVSVETFGASLGKLTKNMGQAQNGSKAQTEAFNALGVSITDSNGKLRNSEDVFYDVIDALGAMDDETQADIYANALFGRSFQDLNPLVVAGTDKLRELGDEAVKVGYVMSQDALDASNNLQDSLDRLKNMTDMSQRSFAQGLAPALDRIVQSMNESLASPKVQSMLKEFGRIVGEIAEGFMSLVGVILENGDIVLTVITSIGAGFAAWKVTTILQTVIGKVKDFALNFANGAKSVIANIKAMDSATMATLIGAIAAVVVAVVQLSDKFFGASQAAKDFKEDAENLNATAQGLASEFTKTTEALALNADKARSLSSDITELNAKVLSGTLSAGELAAAQIQLKNKTIEYNTAVGEEVLKIDEATGAIEDGTEALAANTEALIENAKQAAEVQALTDAFTAQTEAQTQTALGLAEIKSHYDELSESQKALIDDMEQNGVTTEKLSQLWWDSPITGGQVNNEVRTLIEGMEQSAAAEEAASAQAEVLTSQMEQNAQAAVENADALGVHSEAADVQTQALAELTDAEVLHALRMQENGEVISQELQSRLDAYKENNSQQFAAMEELVRKESEYQKRRLEVIQNGNEAIKLSDDVSLAQRTQNLQQNKQTWENYERQVEQLRSAANSRMNQNERTAMNAYLDTLTDGSAESMSIVKQMADDVSKSGGDAAFGLAEEYASTLSQEQVKMQAASFETGEGVVNKTGEGMNSSSEMKNAAQQQLNETVQAMKDTVVGGSGFTNVGSQMIRQIITGINNAKSSLFAAVQSIVDSVNRQLQFSASVSVSTSGSAKKTKGYATGGVVYGRQVVQVAENGPEAIIPLNRMGDIVEGVLRSSSGSGAASPVRTVEFKPSITFNAQKLTDAELNRAVRFVSREFAKVTGGRM